MIFYVDGSKSSLGCQIAITDVEGSVICTEYLGEDLTNIDLEYEAILAAAIRSDKDSRIFTDCKLCVKQIEGDYVVNLDKFNVYLNKIRPLVKEHNISIEWIPREANLAGYILESKVINETRKRKKLNKNAK